MNSNYLDFEQPIAELQAKIDELKNVGSDNAINLDEEIQRLQSKMRQKIKGIFKDLTPWQIAQLSRHPLRPYTLDYIEQVFEEFHELHGDRAFADDHAIVGGLGRFRGRAVVLIGHQKGRDTKAKIFRNFGMPRPEGYRKALRLMHLAAKFNKPVVTLVDTPGAYPGRGSEERGVAEAIARNLYDMSILPTPIISVITGEGGSGGALGIGVGDRALMLENAYYSVISPEGCAAILWKSGEKAPEAAEALKLTGKDLTRSSRSRSAARTGIRRARSRTCARRSTSGSVS